MGSVGQPLELQSLFRFFFTGEDGCDIGQLIGGGENCGFGQSSV